jgi:hypothetical protein
LSDNIVAAHFLPGGLPGSQDEQTRQRLAQCKGVAMALPLLPDLVMARQHASVTFYTAEGPVRLEQPQLLEQLAAVRQRLRGCAPGSVVAIAAPTSARVFIAILAAWAEGLAVSLLPHELGSGSGRLDARRFNAMLVLMPGWCWWRQTCLSMWRPNGASAPGSSTRWC